ncbi:MAG: hypothetical protein J6S14_02015 [Clostridia bacterium]|nr:hypothetical protein [Clostridia bacterium]
MAVDKLVDSAQLDSDLGDIADAILAKSGGTGPIAFPAGFLSEIADIPSGGASAKTATGTFTGDGSQYAVFSCPFEPDAVYIARINITSLSDRVFAGFIGGVFGSYRGHELYQNNANTTTISTYSGDLSSRKFTYADGKVSVATQTSRPVSSSCEYAYYAAKWT